ncbi:MAG: hypothetical protein K5876_03030 [Ruminiclostridium sp.]|nr:hypothetical protein [Ruminiclostridium sp.]
MYSSLGKANDRFGFEAKGTFRVAYRTDSLVTVVGAAVILVWVVLIIINIVSIATYLGSPNITMYDTERIEELDRNAAGKKGNLIDTADDLAAGGISAFRQEASKASGEGDKMLGAFSSGFIGMSTGFLSTAFGLIVLLFLLVAYFIVMTLVRKGRPYSFTANDSSFTVTYPPGKKGEKPEVLVIDYDDVLGLTWETRKFPLLPECYDITVKTRTYGNLEYRVILTKIARTNGITETPFNLIREKIGLANKDERYLINKGV